MDDHHTAATESTETDTTDPPPADRQTADTDGPPVVFEFTVPAEQFLLTDALQQFPEIIVEFERLVPTNHAPLPYLWATDGKIPAFRETIADDPSVARVEKVTTFPEGALYKLEWGRDPDGLLKWCHDLQGGTTVLQAEGNDDEWQLKLRFPSRDSLTEFRDYCRDQGIDFDVVRLYDLTQPKLGQYNISEKQREAVNRALELGYFEIPREATLEDVADSLGISARATSERLRRGQTNLISNTLTIGQPAGLGLGDI